MFLENIMLEITLVSLAMVLVSQILQKKLLDKKKMKANQEKMKEQQKRIKELSGKEDKKSKDEVEKLQGEMLELMNDSMRGTMKHMIVSFPIFIGVFWFLGATYGGEWINLPFSLPVVHRDFSFEITSTLGWLWWYIYSSLTLGIIANFAMKKFEK